MPALKNSDGNDYPASPKRITMPQIPAPALSQKKPQTPTYYSRGTASLIIPKPVNARARKSVRTKWEKQITNKLLWMILGFIGLLLIAIPIVKHRSPKPVDVYNPSKNAALNIVLNTTGGEPFALSSLRGRFVLLNVWSTRCIPCRKEIPVLNALQSEYDAKGLTVVGISWNDTSDEIKRFQKETAMQNYTVLLQGKSLQSTFGGLDALPVTYLVDQQGRIRQVLLGVNDRTTLELAVLSLLNNP